MSLVAGGQPGEYPARQVVDVDTAVTAAARYATDGTLADGGPNAQLHSGQSDDQAVELLKCRITTPVKSGRELP